MNQKTGLYIQTLVDCGSITKAANQLFITPSALSRYIGNLETEIGSTLFSRVGNHFVLTHAGKRYLEYCHQHDLLMKQMNEEMNDISGQKTGLIRMGIQTTLSDFMISRTLPEFSRQFPGFRLSITEDVSSRLIEDLRQYELDFIVSSRPLTSEQFKSELLVQFPNVLMVPESHSLVQRAIRKEGFPYPWIDLKWCRNESFIMMHPEQNPRKVTERFLAPIWQDINIVLEVRSMRTMIEAVSSNIGIICAFAGVTGLYSNNWDNITLLSYGDNVTYSAFYMSHYRDIYINEATIGLMSIISKEMKDIAS